MPTLKVGYRDLCSMIGKELSLDILSEKLFMMKCGVEGVCGDELILEVTSDRPDLLCSEGIARELRGLLGIEKGLAKYKVAKGDLTIHVDESIRNIRPYIAGAVIRGLKLTDDAVRQIMQLQEKLHMTYCRNRTKVSVGIHDSDKVTHRLIYAAVPPEEIRFTPLDEESEMNGYEILESTPKGREYGWIIKGFKAYPLLYDSEGKVLSMPPIINGVITQVTPETENLLLEVTGTDMKLVNFVNNIIATSLSERGGLIESARIIYGRSKVQTPDLKPNLMSLNIKYVNDTLGLNLTAKRVAALLRRMRYNVEVNSDKRLKVFIPAYRADVIHEIDLVEDVAIAYGYSKLEPLIPSTSTIGAERAITRLARRMRDLMCSLGYLEVINYIMTDKASLSEKMNLPSQEVVEVANPLSLDFAVLRNWLIPGLLNFLTYNKHVSYPQRIFECGDVVHIDRNEPTMTVTRRRLGAVSCDYKVSYEEVQAAVYSIFKSIGLEGWSVERVEHPSFIKGRVASIILSCREIGFLGEVHPQVLENFGIENPVAAFELDISSLTEITGNSKESPWKTGS
ncbi:MAG: phenylalanine--tRNA ligase subunit beta [Candidatus Bathyarchaeia archaeon]|nr:phenylalanine--tRNA ligase subunit beta [Candidatus Bathyarchaeota archaeon]